MRSIDNRGMTSEQREAFLHDMLCMILLQREGKAVVTMDEIERATGQYAIHIFGDVDRFVFEVGRQQ